MICFHEMPLGRLTGTGTRGTAGTHFAVYELTDVRDRSLVDFERRDMIPGGLHSPVTYIAICRPLS